MSSDIDLVFVYDEGGETQAVGEFSSARRQVTNHEFFDRLARRVIASINEIDGTGFVFAWTCVCVLLVTAVPW